MFFSKSRKGLEVMNYIIDERSLVLENSLGIPSS
jgi:hypothetical protein